MVDSQTMYLIHRIKALEDYNKELQDKIKELQKQIDNAKPM
jgi:chaperonin cofactor prefoldin